MTELTGFGIRAGNQKVSLQKPFNAPLRTIECWVRMETTITNRGGIMFGTYPKPNCINFEIYVDGQPRLYWNNGKINYVVEIVDLRTGRWEHLAFVIRPTRIECFHNGAKVHEFYTTVEEFILSSAPIIGGDYRNAYGSLQGDMSNLKFWKTARTPEQIQESYQLNHEISDDLMGFYKFDTENECQDHSPYQNHGQLTSRIPLVSGVFLESGSRPLHPVPEGSQSLRGLRFKGGGFVQFKRLIAFPRTVEFWVRIPVSLKFRGGVMLGSRFDPDSSGEFLNFEIRDNGRPALLSQSFTWLIHDMDIRTGRYEHIAWVFSPNGSTIEFYHNGQLWLSTNSVQFDLREPRWKLRLGRDYLTSKGGSGTGAYTTNKEEAVRHFVGDIDFLRMWHDSRSAQQIKDGVMDFLKPNREVEKGLMCRYTFKETLEDMDKGYVLDTGKTNSNGFLEKSLSGDPFYLVLPDKIWKCKKHSSGQHDFFVSYRVATEQTQAQLLALQLDSYDLVDQCYGPRKVKCFWDKNCLPIGEDFKVGFVNGLSEVTVIIPLVSKEVLYSMRRVVEGVQDNVLLEWDLSLDRFSSGSALVVPILFLDENEETFGFPELEHYSDTATHLSPGSGRSVRDIISGILKLPTCTQKKRSQLYTSIPALMNHLHQFAPRYQPTKTFSGGIDFFGSGGFIQLERPFSHPIQTIAIWATFPKSQNLSFDGALCSVFDGLFVPDIWAIVLTATGSLVFSASTPKTRDSTGWSLAQIRSDLQYFRFEVNEIEVRTGRPVFLVWQFCEDVVRFFLDGKPTATKHFPRATFCCPTTAFRFGGDYSPSKDKFLIARLHEIKFWSTVKPIEQIPLNDDFDKEKILHLKFTEQNQQDNKSTADSSLYTNHGRITCTRFNDPRFLSTAPQSCTKHASAPHHVYIAHLPHLKGDHVAAQTLTYMLESRELFENGLYTPINSFLSPVCSAQSGDPTEFLLSAGVSALNVVLISIEALETLDGAQETENVYLLQIERALNDQLAGTNTLIPIFLYSESDGKAFPFGRVSWDKISTLPHASKRSHPPPGCQSVRDTIKLLFTINGLNSTLEQIQTREVDFIQYLEKHFQLRMNKQVRQDPLFSS